MLRCENTGAASCPAARGGARSSPPLNGRRRPRGNSRPVQRRQSIKLLRQVRSAENPRHDNPGTPSAARAHRRRSQRGSAGRINPLPDRSNNAGSGNAGSWVTTPMSASRRPFVEQVPEGLAAISGSVPHRGLCCFDRSAARRLSFVPVMTRALRHARRQQNACAIQETIEGSARRQRIRRGPARRRNRDRRTRNDLAWKFRS